MSDIEKKVVLFGKTGAGKSTIANVFVTGGIESNIFPVGNEPKGCTCAIKKLGGRGWMVTDTIGLGEADTGAMPNDVAKKHLTDFLKNFKDEYSHIIFVQKAERLTPVDEMMWLLFTSIFDGAEEAFLILFTKAEEGWLERNQGELPGYMAGIEKLEVDIPPIIPPSSDRPLKEKRNQVKRDQSLQYLEENLARIFEDRGNRFSVPNIARMNDEELKKKSSSLMEKVLNFIRSTFDPKNWREIALTVSTIVDVIVEFVQTS